LGSDYSDDRLISFSLMQFGRCNARAFCGERFVGQLVTNLGQLVVKHSETQIAEIGFWLSSVAVAECASAFAHARFAKSLWIFVAVQKPFTLEKIKAAQQNTQPLEAGWVRNATAISFH
jgi:hypothetical protein